MDLDRGVGILGRRDILVVVLDAGEVCAGTRASGERPHGDGDAGVLALRPGVCSRSDPVGGVGIGVEGVAAVERCGVAGDGPVDIDAAFGADGDGVGSWVRQCGAESAESEKSGDEEEFREHFFLTVSKK